MSDKADRRIRVDAGFFGELLLLIAKSFGNEPLTPDEFERIGELATEMEKIARNANTRATP